jgi:hypothetical protein
MGIFGFHDFFFPDLALEGPRWWVDGLVSSCWPGKEAWKRPTGESAADDDDHDLTPTAWKTLASIEMSWYTERLRAAFTTWACAV